MWGLIFYHNKQTRAACGGGPTSIEEVRHGEAVAASTIQHIIALLIKYAVNAVIVAGEAATGIF